MRWRWDGVGMVLRWRCVMPLQQCHCDVPQAKDAYEREYEIEFASNGDGAAAAADAATVARDEQEALLEELVPEEEEDRLVAKGRQDLAAKALLEDYQEELEDLIDDTTDTRSVEEKEEEAEHGAEERAEDELEQTGAAEEMDEVEMGLTWKAGLAEEATDTAVNEFPSEYRDTEVGDADAADAEAAAALCLRGLRMGRCWPARCGGWAPQTSYQVPTRLHPPFAATRAYGGFVSLV